MSLLWKGPVRVASMTSENVAGKPMTTKVRNQYDEAKIPMRLDDDRTYS